MPIEIRVDRQRGVVRSTVTGALSAEDYLAHGARILATPDLPTPYREIFDTSEVEEMSIGLAEISEHTAPPSAEIFAAILPARIGVIACTDVSYGLGRMFQAFGEQVGFIVGVFRSEKEALEFVFED